MKTKHINYLLVFLLVVFFNSCGNNKSEENDSSSNYTYSEPAPKTRMDGVRYFYNNYDEFDICLGDSYGCHTIKSVSLDGTYMIVKYAYKNGVLRGNIESNGSFTGTYKTYSTNGDFNLRFSTDGSAFGSWNSTSSFIGFSGSMSFE